MFGKRILTIVLSVFTCILFSSSISSAQIRTVLVSPVPGDPIASGTALKNALAGISSPSSTNRWLLKIEPGIYQITGNSLLMRPWVDIEGSGIEQTIIRMMNSSTTPTIAGASNAWGAQGAVFAMRAYEYADAMMAARQTDKQRRAPSSDGRPGVWPRPPSRSSRARWRR